MIHRHCFDCDLEWRFICTLNLPVTAREKIAAAESKLLTMGKFATQKIKNVKISTRFRSNLYQRVILVLREEEIKYSLIAIAR